MEIILSLVLEIHGDRCLNVSGFEELPWDSKWTIVESLMVKLVRIKTDALKWLQERLVLFFVTITLMELFSTRSFDSRTPWTWNFIGDG